MVAEWTVDVATLLASFHKAFRDSASGRNERRAAFENLRVGNGPTAGIRLGLGIARAVHLPLGDIIMHGRVDCDLAQRRRAVRPGD